MSLATAFVTGAAGFIGSHLAERLLNANYNVIGLDCFTDYYSRRIKENNLSTLRALPRFDFVEQDLRQADLVGLLKRGNVRYIFHNAGQAGVRPSWGKFFQEYVNHNILATQALLEAACDPSLDGQIARFIYASSSSVYGDAERLPTDEEVLPHPVSPYGVTKLAAEHLTFLYAKQHGLPVIALRYFSVYGPRQRPDMAFYRFIDALLHHQPLHVLGDGEQTREFTYVSDIVDANLLAMNFPPPPSPPTPLPVGEGRRGEGGKGQEGGAPRVYNIGGGSRVTLNATLELLGELVGAAPRVAYDARAAGDHRHGAADISRARRELGYAPRVSLEEGLRQQVAWQRSQI